MKTIRYLIALLIFAAPLAHAAAPAGSWWDTNYGYRRQISIPAGSSLLSNGYAVSFLFNHAAEVTGARSLASGDDARIAYWNGASWVELDRVVDADGTWNTASSKIWFQTQVQINATVTDDNYYLYYGNSSAGTPPQNADNVFSLFDAFPGNSIDNTKWSTSGTVTVSGGIATISGGARLRSVATFPTDTIWETRERVATASPSGANYYWAANSTNTNNFGNYLRFTASNAATDSADLSTGSSTAFTATAPTSYQLYAFTREGAGAANFFQNTTQVATFATGAPSGNLHAFMRNEASAAQTQQYVWTRVRPYRNPEPVLSLGAQTAYTPPAPVASYSFEETSYNGTAGEVVDSGPNGLNGRGMNGVVTANTSPAIPGNTGTCRYASLDGVNDYLSVPDTAQLDMSAQFGFAAWVRHRTNSYKAWETILAKGDTAYRIHLNGGCNISGTLAGNTTYGMTEGLNGGCTTADLNTNTVPAANTWYHLGATFDGTQMKIYLNGVLLNQAAYTATIATNNYELRIGDNAQQTNRSWNGDIDEVTVWNSAVPQSVIQSHMAATHSCSVVPHFVIVDDGYGIHCAAETITVNVRDAANNAVTTYNQQVTLDTGTGKGDWSLVTGSGTLTNGTADDGIATYQWPLGESSAQFSLSYKSGASSTPIAVYQTNAPTIRDDGTTAAMVWSASGFTVTSAALSNPPPGAIPAFSSPQTAGNNFTTYITAFGTTPTDAQCGVIETYTGAKNLKFWSAYVNPNSGTRNVTINASNIATSEGTSAAQAVTFTNGQASVTANYKDVGLLSISMKDTNVSDPNLPNGIRGSTGNIVVKPSTFVLSNIKRTSDNFANPAANAATGTVFVAAGQSFTATVTAQESGGSATPNFGLESPQESVKLTSTLVLPTLGQNPLVSAPTGFASFANGVSTGTDFSWPEVGIITLTPHIKDGDYLGAGDVVGATSGNVGRFIPFNFGVSASAPSFAPACAASGYVYLGQPLSYSVAPVLTLTARAVGGSTTQNYQNAFFKLVSGTPITRTYSTSSGTLIQPGVSATDPVAAQLGNGVATLTFDVTSGLAFDRTTPVAPFTPTLALNVTVLDTDGVAASTNVNLASTNPFVVSAITSPEQRYGRIAFRNAVGSELLSLPVPMHAEYFKSTTAGFVQNTSDNCTTGVTLGFSGYGGNLSAGETCILNGSSCTDASGLQFKMPPLAGDFVAILRAPGAGNDGTVTVTTVVPSWLRFDWNVAIPGLENPSGIATFGIFKGDAKRIFQTEK